jgi:ubiquinone/menaquinone biosynthesis C-methylase UbiE
MNNEKQVANQVPEKTPELPPDEEMGSFWSDYMYTAFEKSSLVSKIFREAYGHLAPEDAVCPLSFVTNRDLERCANALGLEPGMNLLDLACGGGGPGLWIARKTGANLVGVDFSAKALEQASKRASRFGISERARYCHASMKTTGLEPATFDGAVSIDAIWMAPDKLAVLREVRRLLRPQRWFVFTSWEARPQEPGNPPTDGEYRSILKDAGFRIETYEETADWDRLQRGVYERWLLQQDALAQEMGICAAGMLLNEAIWLTTKLTDGTDRLSRSRRIFVACQSQDPLPV